MLKYVSIAILFALCVSLNVSTVRAQTQTARTMVRVVSPVDTRERVVTPEPSLDMMAGEMMAGEMMPGDMVESNIVEVQDPLGVEVAECGGPASGCRHHGTSGYCFWMQWLDSTCDMGQHRSYFPAMHGYYYFRPYHRSHLAAQQLSISSWGGDRRNPYSNAIFDRVYAEYDAARQGNGAKP